VSSLFDNVPEKPPAERVAPTPIRRGVSVVVEPTDDGRYWVTRVRDDAHRGAMIARRFGANYFSVWSIVRQRRTA